MIHIFINSLLIVLLFTPFGLILSNNQKKDLTYYSSQLLYALVLLSFIGLLINFFLPLSAKLNSIIIIISIILIIKNRSIYFNKNFFIFILFAALIILILLLESNVYRPDAGLYHLPYIKIINDEKIIIGLSNFHFRYGHISIIQYLSALSNNLLFKENGIIFSQALIAASVIINFSFKVYEYNKSKIYNFHFYFLISILIFIFYKMSRYGEYGNDAPSHFLFFFLISELLALNKDNIKDLGNIFLIILFIILNKLTLLMCFFLGFFTLRKNTIISLFKLKRFYFLIFFTIIWLAKNILISGCLIYPVKSTCFDQLIWTDIDTVKKVSIENEGFTKDWPMYQKIMNKKEENTVSIKEYSKDFFWVKFWLKGHNKKVLEILIPYLIFLLFIFLYLFYQKKTEKLINKDFNYIIIILFLSCILWFIKVPMFRYGYSYIIGFISLIFATLLCNINTFKRDMRFFFNLLLIFLFSVLITKNTIRIIKNDNNYNNYPWPKYYSMDDKNISHGVIKEKLNGKIFYKPVKYCMYSNSPCGNYGLKSNLDTFIIKSYLVMYLK